MNHPTTWWALGLVLVFGIALYQLQVSDPLALETPMKTAETISVSEQALTEDYHAAYEKMVQGELKDLLNDATATRPPARPKGFERAPRVVHQFPTNAQQRSEYYAQRR